MDSLLNTCCNVFFKFSGTLATICAGGTAGLFLWVAIFPIDVTKSRIQVLSAKGKQSGFFRTFHNIIRKEGECNSYSTTTITVIYKLI